MTSGIDSPQELGPFCTSVGHERLPAAAVGVFDDGDEAYADVPYCASCAHALIECGEFTVTRVLNALALGSVACPECGGTGRLSRAPCELDPVPIRRWPRTPRNSAHRVCRGRCCISAR